MMVKIVSLSIAVAVSAFGLCQSQEIKLGTAVPIDVNVTEMKWQPAGNALIYRRKEENGFGLGAYALGKFEGKVLIHIPSDATYRIDWFNGVPSALVTVRQPAPDQKVKSDKVSIYLVDSDAQVARQVYSQIYAATEVPNISIENSPLLRHGIVRFQKANDIHHMVLCLGRGDLTSSPDLDRAAKQGLGSPIWSSDGTAIFSNTGGSDKAIIEEKLAVDAAVVAVERARKKDADADTKEFKIVLARASEDEEARIYARTRALSIRRPAPPTGTPVFELMPGNGVLRPIRFGGAWEDKRKPLEPIASQRVPILVQFDKSNAQDESVWVKRGYERDTPSTLVAVHATSVWMSPRQTGIAYLIDGTLFFKSLMGN